MKYLLIIIFSILSLVSTSSPATQNSNWATITQKAQGQTVYFYAWGGSQEINNYIANISRTIYAESNVSLKHVKVANISETIQQILAENVASKTEYGSVDLIWINGQNFKTLKQNNMLFGPLSDKLPNWTLLDKSLPISMDFAQPTDDYEAPWGIGQLVFIHDTRRLANPPLSFMGLLSYAKAYPNKISYPQPPEFHGSSFLKAALIELSHNNPALYHPVAEANYETITAPLWQYLDELHKVAWRQGTQFPQSSAQTMQLLDDGELDLAIAFNPNAAKAAISNGTLTETARAYAFSMGALSNLHFLAIPQNSSAKEGALVVINILLSPSAQLEKAHTDIWGDPSVLTPESLQQVNNTDLNQGFNRFPSLEELHPSWQSALENSWKERYGQ